MDAKISIARDVEHLVLSFFCANCDAPMVGSTTFAGEPSLVCTKCRHEVAYSTRLVSCKVAEKAYTAPLGSGR